MKGRYSLETADRDFLWPTTAEVPRQGLAHCLQEATM